MKRIISAAAAAVLLIALVGAYSDGVNERLSQNIVRLHIIANSDSDEDQALKLAVRDAILKESREISQKSEAASRLDEYKAIAERVIAQNGADYAVDVEYGNFYFPTKRYKNAALPAGNYDAVRVKIGNAEGQNWWCVMFPPLCFTDAATDGSEALADVLSDSDYALVSDADTRLPIEIKFKVVEWYEEIKNSFTANAKEQ